MFSARSVSFSRNLNKKYFPHIFKDSGFLEVLMARLRGQLHVALRVQNSDKFDLTSIQFIIHKHSNSLWHEIGIMIW